MWAPFAIDAKGGEMKTKGEMQTKGDHAHRGSMSCCHQWQRGRLLMKLSLMPTWTCSNPTWVHWCHQFAEDLEYPADDAEDPRDGLEALVNVGEAHEEVFGTLKEWWRQCGSFIWCGMMMLLSLCSSKRRLMMRYGLPCSKDDSLLEMMNVAV